MKEDTEELTLDRLLSMDKPSLYALAILASKALNKNRVVVFAVDVLNRVQIMPLSMVELKSKPRVEKEVLDAMDEGMAIQVMTAQGDDESIIISYIQGREESKE